VENRLTKSPANTATVVGIGMVAALGTDVAMNCAAARAGIIRAGVLENYRIRSAVEGKEEPVTGHAARLLTRGFEGDVRLVRLAQGALADLLAQTPHIDWRARRVLFYFSLPDSKRSRPVDDPLRPDDQAAEFERASRLLIRAAELAGWEEQPQLAAIRTSGHAGGLEAARTACEDLLAGTADTAIVLGVDSLLDARVLDWLHAHHRLKCDEAPDGLQPGEAGVAIVLAVDGLRPVSGSAAASVLTVHTGREPRHLLASESARGEVLAQVVSQAWSESESNVAWLILDQNGEVHRAMDWGHALVRLRAWSAAFSSPAVWYPAASFGDTGAASALVGICMSVRAWDRNYAPGETALVASVSDGAARAAVALRKS
jgi:3-oxoacyl-[acyl-carrier-protein] synthase I